MSKSKLVDYTKISPNSSARTAKISKITIHHMAGNLSVEACGNVFQTTSRQASSNYGVGTDGRIGLYVDESRRAWTSSNRDNDNVAVTIEVANDQIGGNWHVSDKALEATIALCVDICQRNGIKKLNFTGDKSGNLTMHKWFASTLCPGPYLESKFPYIATEVNKRLRTPTSTNEEKTSVKETYSLKQFIKDVQKACGAAVDGVAGGETISKTVTLSASKSPTHAAVKPVQKRLYALGYTQVGKADGIAGVKFTTAVKAFQKDNGCVQDGELTAKCKTWRKLLGMR